MSYNKHYILENGGIVKGRILNVNAFGQFMSPYDAVEAAKEANPGREIPAVWRQDGRPFWKNPAVPKPFTTIGASWLKTCTVEVDLGCIPALPPAPKKKPPQNAQKPPVEKTDPSPVVPHKGSFKKAYSFAYAILKAYLGLGSMVGPLERRRRLKTCQKCTYYRTQGKALGRLRRWVYQRLGKIPPNGCEICSCKLNSLPQLDNLIFHPEVPGVVGCPHPEGSQWVKHTENIANG